VNFAVEGIEAAGGQVAAATDVRHVLAS
jgi:hypothetical protein